VDGTEVQSGVPLTLTITVIDTENSCAALEGVQVDIWHCNASGVYSDIAAENTSSQDWLRGYQITDANGVVTFSTIFPGWYAGRTTHVHLRLRSKYSEASSTTDGSNTTQLFFPQDIIDSVYTTVTPYSARGTNPTTNATDHVYSGEVGGETLLTLSGGIAGGYTADITIGLPITALSG
jgi:protocatechuate 3,4-dioxygenase beta subunit